MAKNKTAVSTRKKPLQERARVTVEAILKATTQLLDKSGDVSTNHIADVAGVSIGSLYQYFPNKDSIFGMLMERFIEGHLKIIEETLASISEENLSLELTTRTIIHALLDSNRKNSRLAKIFVTTLYRPERIKLLQKMDDRMIEKVKEFYTPFKEEVRDDNMNMMLFVLIQSIRANSVSVLFHSKYKIDDPALEDELVRLALGLLRKNP
ncbi:MAG: hypothetical protein COW01_12950 [Bdellovibrionales bacterium CG12_big_fil_rev_8_21_14_0_65_38_15]|nr:MAG: hypothetical protein COW79_08670 [Bdellovibrionales bacterium CG22_combo_CG10-13_8_21_14_all_38_13]PIQ53531.1 MAG: hypothetical protein COW01_12950 [Bdellovibrionales bacterium CG12_big_fil_rev_8_21_14_0_65_38_15]PIR28465.1 MAG: hypothetical protein COV38_15690 [Bdellovibrionales bacterium CG11_big_fil_rev_8_21_14_0_20_38_13]